MGSQPELMAVKSVIVAPHSAHWLRQWVPPGVELAALGGNLTVHTSKRGVWTKQGRVNATALWSDVRPNRTYTAYDLLLDGRFIRRPRPVGGGFRKAMYCLEAAPAPKGPFHIRMDIMSEAGQPDEFVFKCCWWGAVLTTNASGYVHCTHDSKGGYWGPGNSPALVQIDPEVNFGLRIMNPADPFRVYPVPSDLAAYLQDLLTPRSFDTLLTTGWGPCGDYYRDANGSLYEVMGYNHSYRLDRAAYWVSRHLSFVALVLLAAAVASVASNPRLRASAHGWALASHAACLLLFNALQVVYYLTTSSQVDSNEHWYTIPHLAKRCLAFGLSAYFLLTAAGCWLTAVCINMAHGFRLQAQRQLPGRSTRRTFAWLSALAWGAALSISVVCACVVALAPGAGGDEQLPWYRPSLMETRTCYNEARRRESVKWGTLLYYYGPQCALVAANATALSLTARRVHYLRRGRSLLRRDEHEAAPGAAATATGAGRNKSGGDPQSVIVYLKLLLSAGGVEMILEAVAWALTKYDGFEARKSNFPKRFVDHTFAYRTAGYCADFVRAVIVLWLCAPDRGALRAIWRRIRGKEDAGARKFI